MRGRERAGLEKHSAAALAACQATPALSRIMIQVTPTRPWRRHSSGRYERRHASSLQRYKLPVVAVPLKDPPDAGFAFGFVCQCSGWGVLAAPENAQLCSRAVSVCFVLMSVRSCCQCQAEFCGRVAQYKTWRVPVPLLVAPGRPVPPSTWAIYARHTLNALFVWCSGADCFSGP
jgi:hypothetical protein